MNALHMTVHPGEIIREDCLPAMNKTFHQAAIETGIRLERLTSILNCQVPMTQKEAETLSAYVKQNISTDPAEIQGTADMFIRMQDAHYAARNSGSPQP